MGLFVFLAGIALGVGLATVGLPLAEPYLPATLRGKVESVQGYVTRKQREPGRVLLTLDTSRGSILATFTEKVAEVDLLVIEGDTVTLGLRRVQPFVENPTVQSVKKPADAPSAPGPPSAPGTPGGSGGPKP